MSARRWSGGRGGRRRRRRWRSGVGLCWVVRQGDPIRRSLLEVGVWPQTVGVWRRRFVERRLDGLVDEPHPGRPLTITDEHVEALVVATLERAGPQGCHAVVASLDGRRDRIVQIDHRPDLEDLRAQASTHRSTRWKKTSATGSTTGTRTPNHSPGRRPQTRSSNDSPHIFTEFLAHDTRRPVHTLRCNSTSL
jgi:hypothetical protein